MKPVGMQLVDAYDRLSTRKPLPASLVFGSPLSRNSRVEVVGGEVPLPWCSLSYR